MLAGVFAGLAVLATDVLPARTPVAAAAATLAAAALFNPLRRQVQRAVDRRFNRARYNAEAVVAAFTARLRRTVDLDTVQGHLLGVVHQAFEPAHVSVRVAAGAGQTRHPHPRGHCRPRRPARAGRRRGNIGNSAGKLGNHSRSATLACRHTVALELITEPKETVMNPIKHLRRLAAAAAGLTAALVAFSTPAFAVTRPEPAPGLPAGAPAAPVQVHTVMVGGMHGWQIALIAVAAALLAATAAVLLDRALGARKPATATA